MIEQLHERRLEILGFLARRAGTRAGPPSVREIAEAVGLRSKQTVHHHLTQLEGGGYIERAHDRYRTPRLTEKGWEAVGRTPLLGRIAAGRGVGAGGVEEDEGPPDGTVVVALLRGEEVTVKRLYRDGEIVRLRPENGEHEEIIVPVEDVQVQGRVVYVLHPPANTRFAGPQRR